MLVTSTGSRRLRALLITVAGAASVAGCRGGAEPLPARTAPPTAVADAGTRLADDVLVRRIAPGVWLHVTWGRSDGVLYSSNGMLVETGDGTLLVDTAWDDRQTGLLLRWAAEALGRPVREAVVTHSHTDRTGGLGALAAAGVRASGLGATAALVHAASGRVIDTVPGLDTAAVAIAPGVEAYYPGHGHAPDNIVVYVARQRVLFGGCLVKDAEATTLGNIADADLVHWPEAVHDVAARFPEAATVVPGHGSIGGRNALDASERLLRRLGSAGGSP